MIKEMLQSAIDAGKKKKQKSQPKEKTPPAKPEPLQDNMVISKEPPLPAQPDYLFRTEPLQKENTYEKISESMDNKPTELIRRSRLKERIAEIRLGKAGKKRILAELEKQKEDYNKKNNRP